ncbi:hypothetical protein [Botryobacter ruber]|uniref:hypothetical protein n=1 Tax=Botryobacter ruber TaxID=2171629 RepID=UPI000E0C6365|nr:hypothetical protein [Botryobacter ruber]
MKHAILFTWIFLAAFVAQAQTRLVFEETVPEAYLMRRGNGGSSSQQTVNNIISLLQNNVTAKGGGRPNRVPEFVVRFEQQARIAQQGDKLQLKVQLQKLTVSGDINYKGFDLAEVLLPEKLNYTVKLLNGQQVLKTYPLSVSFKNSEMLLLDTTVPDTLKQARYKLVVEEKEVLYTPVNLSKLQAHLNLIAGYYTADNQLHLALQDIKRVLPDDLDRIPQHDRTLRDLENSFASLKAAQYDKKLNLKQHDPQRLLPRMRQLEDQLLDKRKALNFVLATLDQQYYNRGMDMATIGNVRAARDYFLLSVEVNREFAPSHLQLAWLDFRGGFIREATARTRDILTRMRVDPQTEQQALALAHDIYNTYISEGNSRTSHGDYRNALAAYADARALCSTMGGIRCNMPALNDGEARAAYGMYRGIVEEGKRQLAGNNLAGAERSIAEAVAFQRQYHVVLHDAREAADLQQQVKFQYYVQHIDKGKRHLSERNYSAALSQFDAAQELERQFGFQPVRELGQLLRDAAKPVLLASLSQGYEQAMSNRLGEARATASAAVAMQTKYALEQDADVQNKYNLLRDRIVSQECLNSQAAYDLHFRKAQELARERKFIAADQAYQAAMKAAGNSACGIATFTAEDGRAAIAAAVTYQRMLDDINRFVNSSRYTEAIQRYNEAEQHYLAQEVNRFGLDQTSLYNYAMSSPKQPFTVAVAAYFAGKGNEEAGIQLLNILLDKGYSKGKTKKVQEQIGKQLAQKDAQLGLPESPKVLAASYTSGNKKMKYLGKAYEKERKRLAKA